MTLARKAAYSLFGVLILGTVWLRLGPVVLAGLFSYMVLDAAHRRLAKHASPFWARGGSLAIFAVIAVAVSWLFARFVTLALERLPVILTELVPRLYELAAQYGVSLPFENLHELRGVLIEAVKANAAQVTQASGLLTRGFFQILAGIFVAALCFLSGRSPSAPGSFYDAMRREFDGRMAIFMGGFQKILGAQVLISFIDTGVTALFLICVGMPYIHFLTLSVFMFGVIPVVGTVIGNAMIVATALTISPRLALEASVFLILIHKLQYLLNGRILGTRLGTPMWQILLGLLVGEAVMGVPGMILAPALIHYVREELRGLPDDLEEPPPSAGTADSPSQAARRAKATAA